MAINKERKQRLIDEYVTMLEQAKGVVIAEYRGMTVQQLDALRSKLREDDAGFTVTKNTLLKIALEKVGMAVPDDLLAGPVALAVAYKELPATVKTILEFADDNDILVIKGGIQGATVIAEQQLEVISELPSLDELRAQLAGMVTMPMAQLLSLLEEPQRELVAVIKAGSECLVNVVAAYSRKDAA